jgi:hypothetical protein
MPMVLIQFFQQLHQLAVAEVLGAVQAVALMQILVVRAAAVV